MKSIKPIMAPLAPLTLLTVLALTATLASAAVPHVGGSASDDVSFPEASSAWRSEGMSPSREYLSLVKTGMTKQEMFTYFGKPHFSEGLFMVRKWNYIFHFADPIKGDVTCQYQVHYDDQYLLKAGYWPSQECADAAKIPDRRIGISVEILNPPAVVAAPVALPAPPAIEKHSFSTDTFFDFGKSELNPLGVSRLSNFTRSLGAYKASVKAIRVTGHTDRFGGDEINLPLSQARANAVRAFLVTQGIGADKVTAVGQGSKEPVKFCPGQATESVIACLAENRRVDLVVETQN
jgi:outer membrane protein OmpA-like peptidoglycan-associated protein